MVNIAKFTDPDEFDRVAHAYFDKCAADSRIATVNGLAFALGMTRETLLRYGEKPEFKHTVALIRHELEDMWEQRLAGPNATGTIFWLKNQGWSDHSESHITHGPEKTHEEWLDGLK